MHLYPYLRPHIPWRQVGKEAETPGTASWGHMSLVTSLNLKWGLPGGSLHPAGL